MLGTLATLVAYRRQPKALFMMKHPIRTVQLMKLRHEMKEIVTAQRIAAGVGAALLAVPLGIWLGRQLGEG